MIYHVVKANEWQKALQAAGPGGQGFYEADSLAREGFIHTSKREQVKGVLERYYKGQSGLLLLHIDECKLTAPLKYELAPSVNEEFPHIYGRLNIDAVITIENL
ncbi:MAG TPA: DUF952 domain-containing protein [Ferruginibacter sp.]|jgi:uncharacterized protein (DUF952 family)|nr:DUF952 domain-containing protein [Ferruginibacter sp.]